MRRRRSRLCGRRLVSVPEKEAVKQTAGKFRGFRVALNAKTQQILHRFFARISEQAGLHQRSRDINGRASGRRLHREIRQRLHERNFPKQTSGLRAEHFAQRIDRGFRDVRLVEDHRQQRIRDDPRHAAGNERPRRTMSQSAGQRDDQLDLHREDDERIQQPFLRNDDRDRAAFHVRSDDLSAEFLFEKLAQRDDAFPQFPQTVLRIHLAQRAFDGDELLVELGVPAASVRQILQHAIRVVFEKMQPFKVAQLFLLRLALPLRQPDEARERRDQKMPGEQRERAPENPPEKTDGQSFVQRVPAHQQPRTREQRRARDGAPRPRRFQYFFHH